MSQSTTAADGSQQQQPRTLYVGNLDPAVTEELVIALFGQIGPINGCKIISDAGGDPYAFVEFLNHTDASAALTAMNQRMCLGRELRVNWAASAIQHSQSQHHRQDTSKHHHIFVGDLSPQVDTSDLREAFAPFGEISDCRVVKDSSTQKSKGYGFVSFVNREDAENAIQMMNGSWLGSRAIRTNWAARKPPPKDDSAGGTGGGGGGGGGAGGGHHGHNGAGGGGTQKTLSYDEVFKQSSPANCTVYCGSLCPAASSEEVLREAFTEFGDIIDIRVFKEKGFAFVKYATKDSACRAIVARHNQELAGQAIKCSWGKEQEALQSVAPHHPMAAVPPHMAGPYGPYGPAADPYQMNYWYSGAGGAGYGAAGVDGGYHHHMNHQMAGGDYMNHHHAAAAAAAMYSPHAAAAAAAAAAAGPYGQYYQQYHPMMAMPHGGPPGPMPPYPPPQQYPSQ